MALDMQSIRQTIFNSPNGTIEGTLTHLSSGDRRGISLCATCVDIEELSTDAGAYGKPPLFKTLSGPSPTITIRLVCWGRVSCYNIEHYKRGHRLCALA